MGILTVPPREGAGELGTSHYDGYHLSYLLSSPEPPKTPCKQNLKKFGTSTVVNGTNCMPTVEKWIRQPEEENNLSSLPRSGCPRSTTAAANRALWNTVKITQWKLLPKIRVQGKFPLVILQLENAFALLVFTTEHCLDALRRAYSRQYSASSSIWWGASVILPLNINFVQILNQ